MNNEELHTLFIIDDAPETLEILKSLLEKSFNVHCFESPVAATIKVAVYQPSLIISDYNMSPLNGFKLAESLPQFEFVIFTGNESDDIKKKLFSLPNINEVVLKPRFDKLTSFIEDQLLEKV